MYLLVDIGGTKTLIAIANKDGKILHSVKFPTLHDENLYLKNLLQQINTNFATGDLQAIGIAAPGIIENNKIVSLGNLPWQNFDIAKILSETYNAPAFLENDANLAALSEAYKKSGRSVYLTFSTGIGGGVIENNQIVPEFTNFEPGHDIYKYKDTEAEWEDLASAKTYSEKYNRYIHDIDDKDFWRHEAPETISLGLIPIIKNLQPDRIIFGGPLGFELKKYRTRLRKILKENLPAGTKIPRFIVAKHAEFSVIQGCYLYVKAQQINQ